MRAGIGVPKLVVVAIVLAVASATDPAVAQSACGEHYTARGGDTLVAIAARCGVTVPALLPANPGDRVVVMGVPAEADH